MRELLLACIQRLKDRARAEYEHAELLWQIRWTATSKPGPKPEMPRILRGRLK